MAFIDLAQVKVIAGTGGSGACSFARFKYVPKGGPDGGDGGRGGSIYVRADRNLATLLDYKYQTTWKAQRGLHGKGKNMTGRSGDDLYLPVPPGTVIRDVATGEILGEGLFAVALVALLPWLALAGLGAVPWAVRRVAERERAQKVSRWSELHHLAAGDSQSWSAS